MFILSVCPQSTRLLQNHLRVKTLKKSQLDGPVERSVYHQAWQGGRDARDQHGGGKEQALASCPLLSAPVLWCMCPTTKEYVNKQI